MSKTNGLGWKKVAGRKKSKELWLKERDRITIFS